MVENLFKNKTMDSGVSYDGKTVFPLYQFANIVHKRDMYHSTGHATVQRVLDKPNYKSALEKYGIYDFTTKRKAIVPAMTLPGLKEFLSTMSGDLADNQRAYNILISTLVEASDPSITRLMKANTDSSSVYLAQSRDAVAQERASAGPSIAPPPDKVRAARVVSFCCTLLDHRTNLSVAVAQGVSDVGFKRKVDEDSQIYDWQNDERAFQVQVKQYQRNEDVRTKMIASAEAKVIAADVDVKKKIANADADVKKKIGNAEAYAIRLVADGKKTVNDAEAEKIKAETALLHFELEQKRKAVGNRADSKKSETEEKEKRKLATNAKRRESRALAKAAKDKPPPPPLPAKFPHV